MLRSLLSGVMRSRTGTGAGTRSSGLGSRGGYGGGTRGAAGGGLGGAVGGSVGRGLLSRLTRGR